MSFFSRDSDRNGSQWKEWGNKGQRGRVPNIFRKQGRNKRIRFLIHFDANSKEFNQLVQIDYLNLVGHLPFPRPQAHIAPPLQLHSSIVDFLEPIPMQPTNDGWENIPTNPPSSIV
jgi:hypothetical protein